jgi:arginase family enzyme
MDAVDGGHVAMTGAPQLDGLWNVDVQQAMDIIANSGVAAIDLTGLNPLVEVMNVGTTAQAFGANLVMRFVCMRLAGSEPVASQRT